MSDFLTFIMPRTSADIIIGRSLGCDIIIADEHISAKHLCIRKTDFRRLYISVNGRNGAEVNGVHYERTESCIALLPAIVRLCGILICVCDYHIFCFSSDIVRSSLASIEPEIILKTQELKLPDTDINCDVFTPIVRKSPVYNLEPIELDSPPERKNPEKQSVLLAAGPALTMALPILLGSGRKVMILAGFIAAMWAVANLLSRQKKTRRYESRRRASYISYVSSCEKIINERYREIRNTMLYTYPAIDEYFKNGGNPHLIWNRGEAEEDKFYLRVGMGDEIFPVNIKYPKEKFSVTEDSLKSLPGELKRTYSHLKSVPICVDLSKIRTLAIVTETVNNSWEIAYSMILQLAVTLKESEIRIGVVNNSPNSLNWISYLPHAWFNMSSLVFKADNMGDVSIPATHSSEMMIIFTDDGEVFRKLIFGENTRPVLITDRFERVAPNTECILHMTRDFSGIIYPDGKNNHRKDVIFDRLSSTDGAWLSGKVSRISEHLFDKTTPIPEKVLTSELYEDSISDAETIVRAWKNVRDDFDLSVPLGISEGGRVLKLDIDEKMHGPHGLIAGTTGSGKSELLQTLILSLAINFPPSKVCFFLIDYKGGGMANAFERLPHLAGSISNLSGATIERAFVSIKSEIEYRQKCFAEAKVNNIHDYESLCFEPALPHIVIIIDEFAELKREESEFMAGLVSVAQVGRSLGVHLILSTQKPAGVVDDKIWSNSRFRICLKVRDKADSGDMLHRPDAAYITNIGRAFIQVGNDEIFEEFQCAYSAAPEGFKSRESNIYLFDENLQRMEPGKCAECEEKSDKSQLDATIDAIIDALSFSGEKEPRRLWLNELEPVILPPENEAAEDMLNLKANLGIYDNPASQEQREYVYDFETAGNTLILGTTGSGKSTLLMRMLYCIQRKADPENVNLYILDFGGGRLKAFEESGLCGGYISPKEWLRTGKLINYIRDELRKRQLSQGQPLQVRSAEGHKKDSVLILLVIDNYASLCEYAGRDLDAELSEMMRSSESLGVHFIVSGGGISLSEVPSRIAMLCSTVLTLGLRDKYAYSEAFSVPISSIPIVEALPGRGLAGVDKKILKTQFYYPVSEENENKWINSITRDIKVNNTRFLTKAHPFPYIPDKPTVSELSTFLKSENIQFDRWKIPVGYIEKTALIYTIPFDFAYCVLITGRVRSGRKNTLQVIERMARLSGINTFYFKSVNEIHELIKQKESGIALCNNISEAINDFYCNFYSEKVEEEVCTYLSDMGKFGREGLRIAGIIDNRGSAILTGRRIWNRFIANVYGICLGGQLDDQNVLDFSYMSYSRMSARKKAGRGDVAFYDDDVFAGEIVIPLMNS